MGFSQSTITAVNPPIYSGGQVWISWTSSSPAGTWFQVYLDEQLAWWGQQLAIWLPIPIEGVVRVDIGTVLAGEEQTDFSSSLPAGPDRAVTLSWLGGTYEGADLAGFHVYGEAAAGVGIGYGTPLATITAYPAGVYTDGFGFGGFGYGGFGAGSSAYSWTSGGAHGGDLELGGQAVRHGGERGHGGHDERGDQRAAARAGGKPGPVEAEVHVFARDL